MIKSLHRKAQYSKDTLSISIYNLSSITYDTQEYSFNLKSRSKDTSSPNNETVYSFNRATQNLYA